MSPEKISVAFDATACLGHTTGVGTFAIETLRRLGRHPDVEMSAYALTWRGRHQLTTALPESVAPRTRPAPARPLRTAWMHWDAPVAEHWTGMVDVVHGPNYVVPPTRHAAAVVSVFDLTPIRYPELCNRDTLAYPRLISRAIRRGAWVHTCSRFVADEIREQFEIEPERVVMVPAGTTPPTPISQTGRVGDTVSRLVRGPDPFLLALGTIEPRKDLPALVAAFDRLAQERPDLRLVVAGPDGWGTADFEATATTATHRDRIDRIGWVGESERSMLLAHAEVLVYPSRYEGFGLPPLEAMAAGTAVVSTDAGSLPEVLGNAAALVPADLLVEDRARGIATLAATIGEVLDEDAASRGRRVRAGIEQAARFSWDTTVQGLVALYRTAASSR